MFRSYKNNARPLQPQPPHFNIKQQNILTHTLRKNSFALAPEPSSGVASHAPTTAIRFTTIDSRNTGSEKHSATSNRRRHVAISERCAASSAAAASMGEP